MEPNKVKKALRDRRAIMGLTAGNQVFHNGVPVQLLYRTAVSPTVETWRVRPLFVEGPDREERFTSSDAISFLHTMKAPGRSRAA